MQFENPSLPLQRDILAWLLAFTGVLLAGPASANADDRVRRFDFGSDQMVEQGYVAATSGSRFSTERGFGWLDTTDLLVRDQGKPDDLRRDFVTSRKPATFRISGIQPGLYLLTVICGDMLSGDHATRIQVAENAGDLPVLSQPAGQATTLQVTVKATEHLDITFDSPNAPWIVNAISLAPADKEQTPVVTRNRMGLDAEEMKSHTLVFSTEGQGKKLRLNHWGLDTALPNPNNVRRGLLYMGPDQVDIIRVSFPISQPLIDGDLPESKKAHFTTRLEIAKLAGDKPFTMLPDTEAGVHPWYKNGKNVIPDRWVQLIEVAQRYYGKKMESVEAFNEADWGWGQGSAENLRDILVELRKSPAFSGVHFAGPSTLSSDAAEPWYQVIKGQIDQGSTHALGGGFQGYVNFFLNVAANGHVVSQPELHNLVEGIAGAEYGLQSAIWWLTADRARSEFVKAVQGEQLAYAEDRPNFTAAAVYRAPGGKVQAFLGSSERQGKMTTYRFVCRDRDVYFNGEGPQRDFAMSIRRDTDDMINITWGQDVPPPIHGEYVIVNRQTGKLLTAVAGDTSDGAAVVQSENNQATQQQWEVSPLFFRWQDQAYVTLRSVRSGKVLSIPNESYEEGAKVSQTGDGERVSQHWFLDYAGDNCFHIRNRWSSQYLQAGSDAGVEQTFRSGEPAQQWRLIPVGIKAIDFNAPSKPVGLEATAHPVSVGLKWQGGAEADIAGYTIFRSTVAAGPYDTIARGVSGTTYVDHGARDQRPYYYVIKAVDRSLNSSAFSPEVTATPTGGKALVAGYLFESSTSDRSSNANHAVASGLPAYVVGREGSRAILLDGQDDYLRLPVGAVDSNELTIAAWVHFESMGEWQRIFDFGNDESQYFFLTPNSNDGKLRLAAKNGGEELRLNAPAPPDNKWSHIAVTLAGRTATIYVNGKAVARSDEWTIKPADFNPIFNYIGKSQFVTDPLFRGRISDLRIYNYAVPSEEVPNLSILN